MAAQTQTNKSDAAKEYTMKRKSQLGEIVRRFVKNKSALLGLIIIIVLVIVAVFADKIAPYGADDQLLSRKFIESCAEFPFGTDDYGRDILSRCIYGARISLTIGLFATAISCVMGVFLGSLAGFYGGTADNVIMRCIDVLLAIPSMLLALSITAALGNGMRNLILAVGISSIPGYARIVRASILSVKEQEYIEAAHSIGASDVRIILKHVLPNCLAPIIVQATMNVANAILSAASLSFVGLGISPPMPEWGSMLNSGKAYLRTHPHVMVFPGLLIMLSVFAVNMFGDGLRDALDPKLKN